MTSPWLLLFFAGWLEVVWATSMKASDGFTRLGPSALTGIAAFASFWLLAAAMKDLPLGTAYAIWVGIGAVGAAVAAVPLFGDTVSPMRVGGIMLIIAGIAALKLA